MFYNYFFCKRKCYSFVKIPETLIINKLHNYSPIKDPAAAVAILAISPPPPPAVGAAAGVSCVGRAGVVAGGGAVVVGLRCADVEAEREGGDEVVLLLLVLEVGAGLRRGADDDDMRDLLFMID